MSGAAELYCRLGNEKAGTFRLRPFTMVRAGGVETLAEHGHIADFVEIPTFQCRCDSL